MSKIVSVYTRPSYNQQFGDTTVAATTTAPAPATGALSNTSLVTFWSIASVGSSALCVYHGYRRNQSVGWALVWGLLGGMFPIVAPTIAFAEGFAKPINRSMKKNKKRSKRRSRK